MNSCCPILMMTRQKRGFRSSKDEPIRCGALRPQIEENL